MKVSAELVRQAVASGDYARALEFWQQYMAALAAGRLTSESLAEAAELIEWTRPIIAASRARAVERLRALHVAGVYGARPAQTSALVRASF